MLCRIETQQPLAITADDRLRRHHLGVEPRARREKPVQDAAMPVRPVHHRCNTKFMCLILLHYFDILQRLTLRRAHIFVSENTTRFATFRRLSVQDLCTKEPPLMATIRQLPSGHWQVQIRLKGRKASETFLRHDHAREWASSAETQVDKGRSPAGRRARSAKTLGALIDLHIDDMKDVGKPPQRSKSATLEMLQRKLGALPITQLDRERLIRFGRDRAKEGAGPVTLGMDLGAIKLVIGHAAAVHGIDVSIEPSATGPHGAETTWPDQQRQRT